MEINSNNFISRFHHFSGVFCFALFDFFRGDLLCLSFWGCFFDNKIYRRDRNRHLEVVSFLVVLGELSGVVPMENLPNRLLIESIALWCPIL